MTDQSSGSGPLPGSGEPSQAGDSAGSLLRRAREAAGLHIGALSVALKVPAKKLEALEADRLDQLPDAVFVRALASSVCRNLKIDPAPILARLPDQIMPNLELDSSTTDRTNLHPTRAIWNAPLLSRIPRAVIGIAALLLVAAVVLLLLPDAVFQPSMPDSAAAAPAAVDSVQPGSAGRSDSPAAGARANPSAVVETGTASAVAAASGAAATAIPATVPLPAAMGASTPASASVMASGNAALGLRARSASWVEVTDAGGTVHLRKILKPGESVAVSGSLPLSVVVGRADAIDVQVRGKAFDLVPLARDNVARFEVK